MNWLAHALLSPSDVEIRLGNLLADLVKGRDRLAMSAAFLDGVRRHQMIDSFTDSHPLVHRSRARIRGEYQHVTGILVDVFYDHFLACDWDRYSREPLAQFTTQLYAQIQSHSVALLPEAQIALERMIRDDRLGSYRSIEGITATLKRVSIRLQERTGRDFQLEQAITVLQSNMLGLHEDFTEFFPQLESHMAKR